MIRANICLPNVQLLNIIKQDQYIRGLLLLLLCFFSAKMLQILFIYIPVRTDAGFLQLKQDYIHITAFRVAFFTHLFTSVLVLIAGFTQFSKKILRTRPTLHRTLGYVYVINILLVTGPAAFLMSFYANGGLSSQIAFCLLSVLWIGFTGIALLKAVQKNFKAHQNFMIRSFALTLSAITLRIWKLVFVYTSDLKPMDRYRVIAWLGFVLNLLVAEYIIYTRRRKQGL